MFGQYDSLEAFCKHFDTEHACARALFAARWPDGFCCPRCKHHRYSLIRTRRLPLYECLSCRRQTSIISGTIMEGSSTSLTRWFQAIFLLAQPGGISATRLAEIIQVTYKTAWLIAHKIRHATQHADSSRKLDGNVRIQRTFYGYHSFFDARQPLIVGATMDSQHQPKHLKIKQPHPQHIVNENRFIASSGFQEFINKHLGHHSNLEIPRPVTPYAPLIRIRGKVSRWLNETFQGIGAKHLQAYLDEYAFRFNHDAESVHTLPNLFHWCATTPVLIYQELTRRRPTLPVPWTASGGKNKWRGRHLSLWIA